MPNAPGYNATLSVNGSSLFLEGAALYSTPQRLNWLGGDLFQMAGAPYSPCYIDQGGAFDYMVEFTWAGGSVGTMTVRCTVVSCQCLPVVASDLR